MKMIIFAALLLGPTLAEKTGTSRPALANPPAMEGCDVSDVKDLVGQPYNEALAARARDMTGATIVRIVRPGEAVTMDYREDRLTLELDAAGKVVSARCG
jgi:K+/H+ antiporter YhaU regulatory subunit KhtT